MPDVVLVKLGGSLITDKRRENHARHDVIERLAGEIATAARRMPERLVIGHGSGSFGHVAADRHGLGRGPVDDGLAGVAETQDCAARLHRLVVEKLLGAGVDTFSWAPSSALTAAAGHPQSGSLEPLRRVLELGMVPVTYGDVVADHEWGASICSTETVFRFVVDDLRSHRFDVRRLLWMGETGGIYDHEGRTIPRVDDDNYGEVLGLIGDPAGTDVTGGMVLRLETARSFARLGIESRILDGRAPGRLEAALAGDEVPGTVVAAQ